MTASTVREWIVEAINSIVSGSPFTQADFDAQPLNGWKDIKPKSRIVRPDKEPAYFAWLALQWWVNDDDIRAKDPEYGEMRKRQLQDFLEQMKS
jgi:hypothetical protein